MSQGGQRGAAPAARGSCRLSAPGFEGFRRDFVGYFGGFVITQVSGPLWSGGKICRGEPGVPQGCKCQRAKSNPAPVARSSVHLKAVPAATLSHRLRVFGWQRCSLPMLRLRRGRGTLPPTCAASFSPWTASGHVWGFLVPVGAQVLHFGSQSRRPTGPLPDGRAQSPRPCPGEEILNFQSRRCLVREPPVPLPQHGRFPEGAAGSRQAGHRPRCLPRCCQGRALGRCCSGARGHQEPSGRRASRRSSPPAPGAASTSLPKAGNHMQA